jgi:hypothetical protein
MSSFSWAGIGVVMLAVPFIILFAMLLFTRPRVAFTATVLFAYVGLAWALVMGLLP